MTDPAAEKAFRNTAERDAAIEVARADGMHGDGINQPRHIKFGCVAKQPPAMLAGNIRLFRHRTQPLPYKNKAREVEHQHGLVLVSWCQPSTAVQGRIRWLDIPVMQVYQAQSGPCGMVQTLGHGAGPFGRGCLIPVAAVLFDAAGCYTWLRTYRPCYPA